MGFFYMVNHGVEAELIGKVFEQSKKFFSLPLEEKMKLARKERRGYTPLYAGNLDASSSSKGDSKESFYIGPLADSTNQCELNQWPSKGAKLSSSFYLLGDLLWSLSTDKYQPLFVNMGNMMERWTNCLFRLTLHRFMAVGVEHYSVAFFLNPNEECVGERLQSCCDESNPARYPPVAAHSSKSDSASRMACGHEPSP